jgi:hypothetical protein
MDTSRFDAWTRRRFGLATTSALATALGLVAADEATARRKRRKKKKGRCREKTESCSKKKKCCKNLSCAKVGLSAHTFCCRTTRETCTGIEGECCGDRVCDFITGLEGFRCCGVQPASCGSDQDCCNGYLCNNEGNCIEIL